MCGTDRYAATDGRMTYRSKKSREGRGERGREGRTPHHSPPELNLSQHLQAARPSSDQRRSTPSQRDMDDAQARSDATLLEFKEDPALTEVRLSL